MSHHCIRLCCTSALSRTLAEDIRSRGTFYLVRSLCSASCVLQHPDSQPTFSLQYRHSIQPSQRHVGSSFIESSQYMQGNRQANSLSESALLDCRSELGLFETPQPASR